MKKITIFVVLILVCMSAMSQTEYNKFAISLDYGVNGLADESASIDNMLGVIGGDFRYNFNDKVGVGISGGFADIKTNSFEGYDVNIKYSRLNAEAYINAFDILELYSTKATVLFHGGPGISFIRTDNSYSENVPNLRGGVTALVNIVPRVALKGDVSATSNFNALNSIDGYVIASNTGVNSMVFNVSVGLTVRFGKHERHYDDFTPEPCMVTNNSYTINADTALYVYNNTYVSQREMIDTIQYVFFENDKYNIRDSQLNAIFKTYINLIDNPDFTLTVKGWASPSEDKTLSVNSDDYNLNLSKNRAETLKDKLLEMGIDSDRITIDYFGKDEAFPSVTVHDVARRVELVINTNK